MPTSNPKIISPILEYVSKNVPESVLDIGIGFGKWGALVGTSSAGCQTAPPKQWPSYINPLVAELKRYNQKTFKYVLIDEKERRKILGK